MIKVALVRGKYLNQFEGQNYFFNKKIKLTGVASKNSIHQQLPFSVIRLSSLTDYESIFSKKLIKYLSNRILGDSQCLFGLENYTKQFDIFHTADPHYYYSYQLARLRKKELIKKLIVTAWETIPFNNETVFKKKEIKRFVKKNADLFICYTERAKQALILEGVDKRKIKVIKLGVDLKKFKPAKRKSKRLTILFVGRLVEEKGIKDLYEVRKRIKECNVRIIGSDKVNYEKMPEIYKRADIFVMPSKTTKTWEEQYGMVLIEAMASGLPIIAYNSGSIPELLGDAGILVEEGNVDRLIEAILSLIDDKNLRLKLGRMSRDRAKKEFDSRKFSQKMAKIYEDLSRNSD